jgi:GGDEF domain-containing protein
VNHRLPVIESSLEIGARPLLDPEVMSAKRETVGDLVSRADNDPHLQHHPKSPAELKRCIKAVIGSVRERSTFGLLCIRFNEMDTVQADFGEAGREELLRAVYRRLFHAVRTTDVVASGEDGLFLILANDLQYADELEIISARIQKTTSEPFLILGKTVLSGFTIGAVGAEGEAGPSELILSSIATMNRARTKGSLYEFTGEHGSEPATSTTAPPTSQYQEIFELAFVPQFFLSGELAGARVLAELPKTRSRQTSATDSKSLAGGRNARIGAAALGNSTSTHAHAIT